MSQPTDVTLSDIVGATCRRQKKLSAARQSNHAERARARAAPTELSAPEYSIAAFTSTRRNRKLISKQNFATSGGFDGMIERSPSDCGTPEIFLTQIAFAPKCAISKTKFKCFSLLALFIPPTAVEETMDSSRW